MCPKHCRSSEKSLKKEGKLETFLEEKKSTEKKSAAPFLTL